MAKSAAERPRAYVQRQPDTLVRQAETIAAIELAD